MKKNSKKKKNAGSHQKALSAEKKSKENTPRSATGKAAAKNTTDELLDSRSQTFPVVGIGASAGGMEAFIQFLDGLPADLGMAYVYVQHLSPTHQSQLPEILARKTKIPVLQIEQDMEIKKDHVYVVPPNKVINVSGGVLKLLERPGRENFYPIDSFFTSLAEACNEYAIGVLLSGTGTDGALGLKAIKAEGGITFAQDDSARYHDMPAHAMELGYADLIMPPEKIARQLSLFFAQNLSLVREQNEILENDADMRKIEAIMNQRKNVDFSHYKKTTIHRRILRRMVLLRLNTLADYARLLKENNAEVNALYQDLLITVTNFFRDADAYAAIKTKILPAVFKDRKTNDPLRIWIPGCATGEEAISMAITVLEYLGEKGITLPVQIFATDLNERAVERARAGIYLKTALQNVSPQRLDRFFAEIDGQYQVVKMIREMIIYAPHNLLKDPPFSRMDIISCQNVLIYLETAAQNKIFHSFHYALKPVGYLILGRSESIGTASDLFEQLTKQAKIYRKKNVSTPVHLDFISRPHAQAAFSSSAAEKSAQASREVDLEKETEKILLKKFTPASVLVNKELEILRFRGAVSNYMEPASGKASLHLMKMVKEDIAYELRSVVNQVKKEGQPVKKTGLHITGQGDLKEITIEVIPIKANSKETYFLIIFQPGELKIPKPEKGIGKEARNSAIASLERQITDARENMRVMNEDFEATREELQSANEEVLSSNEELQSINEELETSKEELQSTNEELTTINEELQTRNVQLHESYEYAESIFETMHEPLLVLSSELRVKEANRAFYKMFRTSPSETEGHNLYSINNQEWDIAQLREQLKLLQSKNIEFTNFEIRSQFSRIGEKIFLLNAQKLMTSEKKNGLILLAIQDVTDQRFSEEKLKDSAERFRLLIENAFDVLSILSKEGIVIYESDSVSRILGYTQNERIGKSIFTDPLAHPDDLPTKRDAFKKAIGNPKQPVKAEFRLRHKDGSYRAIEAVYENLLDNPRINGVIATYHDITDRKRIERQKEEFVSIASHELKTPITSMKGYIQIMQEMFSSADDNMSMEIVNKLGTQVDKLNNLIRDMLDLTIIRQGKFNFRQDIFNVDKLLNEIVAEMQLGFKTHVLVADLNANRTIKGDRDKLELVMRNLVSNAVKYSPGQEKIIIRSTENKENITISVEDFGIGISEEMRERVFERFFRLDNTETGSFPGLGLGLYIAAEIVKQQGGTMNVESNKGKGSIFSFTIPVVA
jgi:two-component system CheB/CheR fusion protein